MQNVNLDKDTPEMTPTLAKRLIKSVNDLEEQIINDFNRIKQSKNTEDKIATILLGPTGSGKTTLYYALTGKQLKGSKNGIKRKLNAVVPEKHFKIGNTGLSETTIPGIEYDEGTNMIFCDCPGFFDNKGEIQDITNSFAICRVLSQMKNIKILLLVAYQDIIATKGKLLRECCQIVENIIPDRQALQPAISLVITHINPDDIISEDEEVSFLDEIEIGKNGWLLKYFSDHENGKKKVVFYFPSPTNEEIKNETYNGFDRQPILNFIQNSQPTPITPFVSLSTNSKLMILSVVDSFGCLSDILQKLSSRIQNDSTESDANLDIWKERVEELSSNTYPTPKDLVDKAKEIINPSTPLYDSIYESLMKIHYWRSFLELIVRDELSSNDRVLYQESHLLRPVFLNITESFCQSLSTIHSIIIAKLEKRQIAEDNNATVEELKEAKKKEIEALKKRDEQIEQTQKMEYDMQILIEKQKTEIEKCKMQIELEKQRAQLIAQNQQHNDNGPAYITALAPILKAFIEKI